MVYTFPFKSLLSILSSRHPKVESLDRVAVILGFIFLATTTLVSPAAAPFYIPISKAPSSLCEAVFTVAVMIKGKYYVKIDADQEARVVIFNLIPTFENSAQVSFASDCSYLRIKCK